MTFMYRSTKTDLFIGKGDTMRLEDLPFGGYVTTQSSGDSVKAMKELLADLEAKEATHAADASEYNRIALIQNMFK